ncbi:hypothetical protein PILCRDRAFT_814371 [Piloderma croceum F 1598]|uniref:DUF6534 domain-containing protein n=1 Tax=Piloderma croceum (strain F 1598) TaxID=765440 RepID=A0A0C3BPN8_PILCF|nr:hypothetical protein PILCRDRAFT_814371 [Piloderma croceum F 1598]
MLELRYLVTVCSWQFRVESGSLVSLSPQFILGKLYVNSLLATLNSRKHFRALASKTVELSLPNISDTSGPTGL